MENNYLCKAKRIDNREWITGYLLVDSVTGKCFIHSAGNSVKENDKIGEDGCLKFVAFEIYPSTICRCTELTDINGKQIWENDIVIIPRQEDKTFRIKWDKENARFIISFNGKVRSLDGYRRWGINVIGNIFNNPEYPGYCLSDDESAKMNRNLKMPWSMEDTAENMEIIRKIMIRTIRNMNAGKISENDMKAINFDFGRVKNALNKQISKKPDYEADGYADGKMIYNTWICPCCKGKYEVDYDKYDFCPNCGQHIDWK